MNTVSENHVTVRRTLDWRRLSERCSCTPFTQGKGSQEAEGEVVLHTFGLGESGILGDRRCGVGGITCKVEWGSSSDVQDPDLVDAGHATWAAMRDVPCVAAGLDPCPWLVGVEIGEANPFH
jgi:hypothetical protein